MKKIPLALLLLSFALMSFQCDDDEDPGGDNSNVPGALTAKVDGVDKDYKSFPRASLGSASVGNGPSFESLNIEGVDNTGNTHHRIIITLVPFEGEGTYTLGSVVNGDDPTSNAYYETYPAEGGLVTAYGTTADFTGTFVVSSFDGNTVKGNFNFQAIDVDNEGQTITVTNGRVDLGL
jgi:hypothetical protein